MQLGGIHHVTAVNGNASRNVAFYTQVLGMRLTKKTLNQDDVSAYRLFYGDELVLRVMGRTSLTGCFFFGTIILNLR
jgi:catechol 2,3-dioxygenase-like lactoylglutathione lyase family enzyme